MQLRVTLCVIAWFTTLSHVVTAIPLNVKDYGAVGDGVIDDMVAIQAAVNAAGTNGAVIDFPAGSDNLWSNPTNWKTDNIYSPELRFEESK